MIAAAAVAPFAHHRVEPAGRQRRKLLQRLMDEGQIGLDPRATRRRSDPGQARLGQNPRHGAVVHMQLPGDRADAPSLNMIVAQDLRLPGRAGLSCCSPKARSGGGSNQCGGAGTHGERMAGSDNRTNGRANSPSDDPAMASLRHRGKLTVACS